METIQSSNPNGISVAYAYDGGVPVDRSSSTGWDDLNRLSTVTDNRLAGANVTTYTYDSANNLATAKYPNGLTSTFTYDGENRLTELATPPVADYKYTLGLTGIRTGVTEQSGRSAQWGYDNTYRLTGETISLDPKDHNGSVRYSLDAVGNRLSDTSTLDGVTTGSWSYDQDDRVSGESYDLNGNVTYSGGKTFTYDSENHMLTMTSATESVTMVYDAFGNRVSKTVNGVTTKYLVEDDVNPTGYPQVVEELSGSGVVERQYTYGLQRIDEQQFMGKVWTPSFYGYDGFGNVRQLTDSTGAVTDSYEYDAFGNSFTTSGTTPNNYLYRGEQYDSDLGLYYLRARYYNPATGRFMSRDPEDGQIADPKSLHKYLYADGDPVNGMDPMGRENLIQRALFAATLVGAYAVQKIRERLFGVLWHWVAAQRMPWQARCSLS